MIYWNGKGRYGRAGKELWERLVPRSGRAPTIQGELLRCVGRLADELYRNGNGNWGPMFRDMVAFLRTTLVVSAKGEGGDILRDLDQLELFGEHPNLVQYQEGEDEIDRLTEAVISYCKDNPDLLLRERKERTVVGSIADVVAVIDGSGKP